MPKPILVFCCLQLTPVRIISQSYSILAEWLWLVRSQLHQLRRDWLFEACLKLVCLFAVMELVSEGVLHNWVTLRDFVRS
jgi:hypothetical protein